MPVVIPSDDFVLRQYVNVRSLFLERKESGNIELVFYIYFCGPGCSFLLGMISFKFWPFTLFGRCSSRKLITLERSWNSIG